MKQTIKLYFFLFSLLYLSVAVSLGFFLSLAIILQKKIMKHKSNIFCLSMINFKNEILYLRFG